MWPWRVPLAWSRGRSPQTASRPRFAAATRGPDRVRAEFGIKLSAETGMVVVKGTADAHFVLELEWTRHPEDSESGRRGVREEDDGDGDATAGDAAAEQDRGADAG